MVKFGRKFFFDKVHKKRNYIIPIIVAIVLVVALTTTFFIVKFSRQTDSIKPNVKEPKVVFNKTIEIEVYNELPAKEEYFKEIKNIKLDDFEIIYPDNLIIIEETYKCLDEETGKACKKQFATNIGEFKITLKTKKLDPAENQVTLNVVDKTSPSLTLKEVTISEGDTYNITDFIASCTDNSKLDCKYEYANEKDGDGNIIDYNKFAKPGTYDIKIVAKDNSDNTSKITTTKLIINKKKTTTNNNNNNQTNEKPKTCDYGNLKYSNSYVIAVKIDNTECAISAEEAESLSNTSAIKFNKVLVKEIQKAYLKTEIDKLNLEGQLTYDIVYGPVFNTENKGVVGYYLSSEAKQTINGKTTTIARYFIDESGNRVWKINTLNLK